MISLGLTDYTKMPDGPKGIVRGIMPSSNGDAPAMGTRDLLEGFDSMPWLRAVADKTGYRVATLEWQLLAHRKGGKAVLNRTLQRSTGGVRRKLVQSLAEQGELSEIADHVFLDALENPNPFMDRIGLLKITEIHWDLIGDAFWLKDRNGLGAPSGFWPIPPHWVMETPTPSDPTYRVGYRGWQAIIPEREIHRFHEPSPVHPYTRGSGIGWTLGDELEVDEYAAKMARQVFFNKARPDFVVMGFENKEEKDRLEQDWIQRNQGFWRMQKPYFMTGEPKIHEFQQPTMEQLVYPNLRKAQRDIVLQVWGDPPEIHGIVENSNRATAEAAEFIYSKGVIEPRGERMRGSLQRLAREEYDERIIVHYVSPVEADKEYELNAMKAAPWAFTQDEWRVRGGAKPIKSDVRMVPLNSFATDDLMDPEQRPKATPAAPPGKPGAKPGEESRGGIRRRNPRRWTLDAVPVGLRVRSAQRVRCAGGPEVARMSDDRPVVAMPRNPRHKTLVVLSRDVWVWLRAQAEDRALREGGRPNVSLEIERLARQARGR